MSQRRLANRHSHMTPYAYTRLVHVTVAVLGIGVITAGAMLTRRSSGVAPTALRSLIRVATAAMALMVVSGILLDYLSSGAWHHTTWFRIAFATTIAAGIAIGLGRRAVGQAIAGKADADRAM